MSDARARHRGRPPRSRRVAKRVLVTVTIVAMVLSTAFVVAYKKLEGNISTVEFAPGTRPTPESTGPLNVLVMGSDTRAGANGKGIGGSTPGLSDTTMLLHLSGNREFAYGVSLPRDAMVDRPPCPKKNGKGIDPGGMTQFNAAYAIGGPACTVKTVEALTGVRVDHFVVLDFVGFKRMVNAIGGVKICVPEEVDDRIGKIKLPAGTYKVTGQQALDYVRVRHDLGAPTGDIGRMKRQQVFISAMIEKVVSAGTLANPVRLLNFLNAATGSLTTDPGFADLKKLGALGSSLKGVGLDKIQFVTVPWQPYPPDPNRVEWAPDADRLWFLMKNDRKLGPKFNGDAVTVGEPAPTPTPSPSGSPTGAPTATPSPAAPTPTKSEAQKQADARAAGLCA